MVFTTYWNPFPSRFKDQISAYGQRRLKAGRVTKALLIHHTMAENIENLILEHLRGIRGPIDKLTVSVDESRMRIGSLEGHVAGLRRDFSLIHDDIAAIQVRLDHQEDRLSRIEKRLELTAA